MILSLIFVSHPIARIIKVLRNIGKGIPCGKLEIRQRDEIGELASEINRMYAQLTSAWNKLEEETETRIATLQQLRHAERLSTVGTLASGVAHEFGTPLNVISGRAKMIWKGESEGEEVALNAKIIHEQVERMTQIVRQLLNFVRNKPSKKRQINLNTIVSESTLILSLIARKKNVTIKTKIPQKDIEISASPEQIEQVLTNIIMNALQSEPRDGVITLTIEEIYVAHPPFPEIQTSAFAIIIVEDTGIGMDKAVMDRLFEPFFTTKDVGEGTGLGLSVAWGIIREHGGWIEVSSNPEEGSRFAVYLPMIDKKEIF